MSATTPNPGPYDLGPFQEMAAIKWGAAGTGQGTVSASTNAAWLRAHVTSNCSDAISTSSPTGLDDLGFQFDSGVEDTRVPSELLAATYTGLTSGAIWTPNTNMGGGLTFLCQQAFGNRRYQAGSVTTVPQGDVYQWYANAIAASESALTFNNVGLYANYGRFLSRLPVPGAPGFPATFVDGERFSVSFP